MRAHDHRRCVIHIHVTAFDHGGSDHLAVSEYDGRGLFGYDRRAALVRVRAAIDAELDDRTADVGQPTDLDRLRTEFIDAAARHWWDGDHPDAVAACERLVDALDAARDGKHH